MTPFTRNVLVSLALVAIAGCSSEEKKLVSGGAFFQIGVGPIGTACRNAAAKVTIGERTGDGDTYRLLVDGVNSAVVTCQVDDTRFSVKVSLPGQTFFAAGSYTGTRVDARKFNGTGTKIPMTIVVGGIQYRSNKPDDCAVTITENGEGYFGGTFSCPNIENRTIDQDICSINNATGGSDAAFRFANCTGF